MITEKLYTRVYFIDMFFARYAYRALHERKETCYPNIFSICTLSELSET